MSARRPPPSSLRPKVARRDMGRCTSCGTADRPWHVHHIVPLEEHGHPTHMANLATLCLTCHEGITADWSRRRAGRLVPYDRDARLRSILGGASMLRTEAVGRRLNQDRPPTPVKDGEPRMAIIVKGSNAKFENAPEGNHVAVCYGVFDMGTHPGFENKMARKVRICWELSDEMMSDGRPFTVSALYTMSLNEKSNLRRDLVSWRGRQFSDEEIKAFDLANLLGKPAMVGVIHAPDGDKVWANVSSVTPLPKGMPLPKQVNESRQYSIDDPVPDWMPDWIANKIRDSVEKKAPSVAGLASTAMMPAPYAPDYASAAAEAPPF